MQHRVGLAWFQHDLRLHDNPSLLRACTESERLLCVYCVEPNWFQPNRYGIKTMGAQRWRFLHESLVDLNQQLEQHGQRLIVSFQQPLSAIAELITKFHVDHVYRTISPGHYENQRWQLLKQRYPYLGFTETHGATLYDVDQLPFQLTALPRSFTPFRKKIEAAAPRLRLVNAPKLPPPPGQLPPPVQLPEVAIPSTESPYHGGERAGLKQLRDYFATSAPGTYKETRNALDGWLHSTKFSPWLATGALSPRTLAKELTRYENKLIKNESTYWIYFELLWREYFQWYGHRHGVKLFHPQGVNGTRYATSFYPARFQKWMQGNTPYPIVNACMKQLNATGYMSNRGRQLVASCLVNELAVDWRYGAAYFEQQLLDYDVASNWGNWQYLGGVGADPRGKRQFDLTKQQKMYDPDQHFINRWQGHANHDELDANDAADWPIS